MNEPETLWSLTPHVCSVCQGRLLKSGQDYRCSVCTTKAVGSCQSICGCGIRVKGKRIFRCIPNPDPGGACPAEYVIGYNGRFGFESTS